jgi:methylenetetrahydrofolate dehydrogenase (NADP+)/methenyltetrahydrofolate cyclohydrolase
MALLLLHRHATVTVCHSKTADLPGVCREADLLVAAIGRAAMITRDYIRPGAVVVDVGVNRVDDASEAVRLLERAPEKLEAFRNKGSVLVGDVHPADAAAVASAYTPVPGGVGPLTIAMLMASTVELAERRLAVC